MTVGFFVDMHWSDEGIVLSARKHGETSVIVCLMTAEHGRHAGLVRGGTGRRARGLFEAGNFVTADWRARLDDHLGAYTCELLQSNAALVLDSPLRLTGLSSACAVTERALPEREPFPKHYRSLSALLARIEEDDWVQHYVLWELQMLTDLGFGLDLSVCAATGSQDRLVYVSPKSGQAVSEEAGYPYRQKLLPLPSFLLGSAAEAAPPSPQDLARGLELTGYFLERRIFNDHKSGSPSARTRFVDRLTQKATISSC